MPQGSRLRLGVSMDSREQFEQAFCEDNGNGVADPAALAALVELRMGDSYRLPGHARAWNWWKRARAGVVVVLPKGGSMWDDEPVEILRSEAVAAIEAAGVTVAVGRWVEVKP